MIGIWQVLAQFVFRLTFGVALAMALTPSRLVTSGFFRVHLWVLMGLNTFAALVIYSQHEGFVDLRVDWRWILGFAVALAVASYAGSVLWLYERPREGWYALLLVSVGALGAALLGSGWVSSDTPGAVLLKTADIVTGGLLLGATLTAMFLGHWYLNTPTMDLMPIKRLVILMGAAVGARLVTSATGLTMQLAEGSPPHDTFWIFVAFRWLAGLVGTSWMAWLAWQTLKVPNTQSATGILYAGVILVFLGELVSQLLSVGLLYPI